MRPLSEWVQIGNNDLRAQCDKEGGFSHVALKDVDDGDLIIVNEDDVIALRDYLSRVIEEHRL